MVKVKIIGIAAVAVVLLVGGFFIFQGEEAKVKKQFKALANLFAKVPTESKLVSATRANRIQKLFAQTAHLQIPEYDIEREVSRRDIPALVLTGRERFKEIELSFHDIEVEFPESARAEVSVTADLSGALASGEGVDEIHELDCLLEKVEETWVFRRIQVVEVLRR